MMANRVFFASLRKNYLKCFSAFQSSCRRAYTIPATIPHRSPIIIHLIPTKDDYYSYVIADRETEVAAIVDAIDFDQIHPVLKSHHYHLKAVLNTHNLPFTAKGNDVIARLYPEIPIYGGDVRIAEITKMVKAGELVRVGNMKFKCLLNPEQSGGRLIYFLKSKTTDEHQSAFVGDTLSVGGIGNFAECSDEYVYSLLSNEIAAFPDSTDIFTSHENTIDNLRFALIVEPENNAIVEKLQWAMNRRAKLEPTVPSTIAQEKRYNPFLRLRVPAVQKFSKTATAQDTLYKLREQKLKWTQNEAKLESN